MLHSESYFLLYLAFISHSHRPFPLHGVKFKRTEWLTFQRKGLCWVQRIALCVEATKVIYVGGEEMSLQKVFPKDLKRDIETNCYSSITHACVCVLSHFPLFATLCTIAPRILCPWVSPGNNTGVDCHALLQGSFLTQGSNPCLLCPLHCKQFLCFWVTWEAPPSIITKAFGGRSMTHDWPPLNVDCPESTVRVLTLK